MFGKAGSVRRSGPTTLLTCADAIGSNRKRSHGGWPRPKAVEQRARGAPLLAICARGGCMDRSHRRFSYTHPHHVTIQERPRLNGQLTCRRPFPPRGKPGPFACAFPVLERTKEPEPQLPQLPDRTPHHHFSIDPGVPTRIT